MFFCRKVFWENRYFELKKEGRDPNKHDFTEEWKRYWKRYINKYYETKIQDYRNEIEDKLLKLKCKPKPYQNHNQVEKQCQKTNTVHRSFSPVSSLSSSDSHCSLQRTQPKKKVVQNKLKRLYSPISSTESSSDVEIVTNESVTVTVVSVCRILAALDNELGLLSNKVFDLLARSLELEKAKPNSSEILMTGENLLFLETVKEKLKGMVAMNLLSANKV